MIWLLMNVWWLVPALVGVAAVVAFLALGPVPLRALAARVPLLAWQVLACVVALSLASSWLIGVGEDRCAAAPAKAEDKADVKAAKVTGDARDEADQAKTTIRKESQDAQAEARVIVRSLPAACPAQPDRLRELGDAAVEAASRGVPAAANR